MTKGTQRGRRVILVGLLALAWLFGGGAHPAGPELGPLLDAMGILPPVKETEAPDFTLHDLAGKPRRLAEFRGQVVLINFWATWCPPCVEELPMLDRFQRETPANGWQVLGLAIDQPSSVARFLTRTPLGFPVGLAGLGGTELSRALGNESGGLPFSVVIAADGRVIQRKMGQITPQELAAWTRSG